MGAAIIDNSTKLFRVIARALRGAPNTCPAKLTAPTLFVVIGTVHLSPRMRSAFHNAPTFAQGIFNGGSNFLFWVGHRDNLGGDIGKVRSQSYGCQVTTVTLV
jgi:hypothetical protein